jgi:hypothetical protein
MHTGKTVMNGTAVRGKVTPIMVVPSSVSATIWQLVVTAC